MNNILKKYVEDGLLHVQHHPSLPLSIYNYTQKVQYENLWDDITLMCRGLVIDNEGNIVARPFKKFFNLSEGKTLITDDYKIMEKLDGSLGILFYYNREWIFSSKGSFTSEQAIRGKEILGRICDYSKLNKKYTYCFEIIYPENKIVVDYGNEEKIVLLSAIFTKSGNDRSIDKWGLPYVKSFDITTPLSELHKYIKNNEEGYVILFSNGERCKIKGEEYLRLHKIMASISTTSIWECLSNGSDISSVLENIPDEFYSKIKEYENSLKLNFSLKKERILSEFYTSMLFNKESDDKTYALNVIDDKYKSFFFSLRKGKNIDQAIWMTIKPKFKKL